MDPNGVRKFVGAVLAVDGIPVAIRNECHQLLLAVEREDAAMIRDHLVQIQRLAASAGVTIPRGDDES
jgi:hypothetical protein